MPIVLLLALLLQAQSTTPAAPGGSSPKGDSPPPTTRPAHDRDPWVFRCVLDDNARMLVISLGDHWWMAFDTVHCSVYKIWNGEIELTGAVYDTKHGPQPHAKGTFLLDGKSPIRFEVGASPDMTPAIRWLGYSLHDDHVTLKWNSGTVGFELTPIRDGEMLRIDLKTSSESAGQPITASLPADVAMLMEPSFDGEAGATRRMTSLPHNGETAFRCNLTKMPVKHESDTKEEGK